MSERKHKQLEGRREEVLSDIRLERSEFENMAQRAGPNVQLEARVGSRRLQVRRDGSVVAPIPGCISTAGPKLGMPQRWRSPVGPHVVDGDRA